MTIRLKVILIVIFSVVALTLTMYVVTQTVLLKSYINIENDEAVKNLERADNAIQKVLEGLGLTVKDWTTWDPPYSFVQGKNPSFKDTDLTTLGMVNIKLNAMVFVNTDHKVVFSKMVDLKTSTDIDPEGLVAYITAHDQLITEVFQNGSASGIVDLPSGPMFLAMHTIIHSDGSGPPAGVLVFGKDLNEDVVKSLEDSTNLSIGLYPYNSTLLSDDITMAIKMLSGGVKFHIQYVSDQNMAVHKLINDISGAPVLVMRVETPRPIYNQGKSSLYFFMALAVAMTLLVGAII